MSTSAGQGHPGGSQQKIGARSAEYGRQGTDYPDESRGAGERAQKTGGTAARHVKTPETKEFFKTSEFVVWGLTVLAILIAGAVIGNDGGADDNLKASLVWTLVAATSIGYIVSRGISKAGARRGYGEAPMDQGQGGTGGY